MNDTTPAPNAIDTALIKGNRGCQFLEIHRPSKQDLKTASEAFKEASEILKASLVLLDHDCYTVTEAPQSPAPPLFKPDGAPTPAADVTAKDGAEADLSRPALGCIDVEIVSTRRFKVGDKVKATASAVPVDEGALGTVLEDDGSAEDESPYLVNFEGDGDDYYNAEDLELVDSSKEDEEQAGKLEIINEPFPGGNKAAQKKVFEERLTTLEDIFCERLDLAGSTEPYGKQLKQFRPHRDAWIAAWKTDPKQAWTELLKVIAVANVTATEFTAWAPAA